MTRLMNKHYYVELVTLIISVAMLLVYFFLISPFPVKKTLALEIEYENKTYSYENLPTGATYVNEFIVKFNKDLELGYEFDYDRQTTGTIIRSLKNSATEYKLVNGTFSFNDKVYLCFVNDQYYHGAISGVPINDGDTVKFVYATHIVETKHEDGTFSVEYDVLEGGDDTPVTKKNNMYDNILTGIFVVIAILVVATIIFMVFDYFKYGTVYEDKMKRIEKEKAEKEAEANGAN